MQINIRPILASEIEQAKKLVPSDAAEPDWGHVYAVTEGTEIIGIIGTEVRLNGLLIQLVAEPLYMGKAGAASLVAFGFLDGIMRAIASVNHLPGYGFNIRDCNGQFQRFAERRLPVTWTQGDGERKYWRSFS